MEVLESLSCVHLHKASMQTPAKRVLPITLLAQAWTLPLQGHGLLKLKVCHTGLSEVFSLWQICSIPPATVLTCLGSGGTHEEEDDDADYDHPANGTTPTNPIKKRLLAILAL